ncbi:hypothetical protein GALMADRAFT_791386 [Galerina marginata CBS 339.88]|uniref:Uncharacterized protein n=1 Tax=Galerina marginata (strain CBS 339.88) TaxID=685588 RepID=A0A067SV56_GALM3|nr:hypothetical protein GALMADRAFT_791386 [Galerina marginata CBS 339.88]
MTIPVRSSKEPTLPLSAKPNCAPSQHILYPGRGAYVSSVPQSDISAQFTISPKLSRHRLIWSMSQKSYLSTISNPRSYGYSTVTTTKYSVEGDPGLKFFPRLPQPPLKHCPSMKTSLLTIDVTTSNCHWRRYSHSGVHLALRQPTSILWSSIITLRLATYRISSADWLDCQIKSRTPLFQRLQ